MEHTPEPPRPAAPASDVDPARARGSVLELLLRRPDALFARLDGPDRERALRQLVLLAFLGHLLAGLVVGSFSGGAQWWAAPLKVAFGMVVTGAICFPSLYIFVSFCGADARATQVLGLLLALLALVGVFLAGFAPIAWVFSQSSTLVSFVGTLHLFIWAASMLASYRVLVLGLRHMKARNASLIGLWALVLFVTSLQMMTALRPLVGTSDRVLDPERRFFLQHWVETIREDSRTR